MTIQTLLKQSGIKYTRHDAQKIGLSIMAKAMSKKVKWTKKEELIEVNDYPEEFKEEMIQIAIEHFKNKTTKK